MDSTVLTVISQIAPEAGKILSKYFAKRRDIPADEVQIILLSKLIENDKAIVDSQTKIISTSGQIIELISKLTEIASNHMKRESELTAKFIETLNEVCDNLRTMRAELIRKGLM